MRPAQPIDKKRMESLSNLLKQTKNKGDFQRVQCVWIRAALGLSSEEVAVAVGWSGGRVRQIQAAYLRKGEESLLGEGRGGRRRENLSRENEAELLARFLASAQAGEVLVVSEIKEVYESQVGHAVPKSTIYRVLARHGWRKVSPRPRHPKSDLEAAETFKKTSQAGS